MDQKKGWRKLFMVLTWITYPFIYLGDKFFEYNVDDILLNVLFYVFIYPFIVPFLLWDYMCQRYEWFCSFSDFMNKDIPIGLLNPLLWRCLAYHGARKGKKWKHAPLGIGGGSYRYGYLCKKCGVLYCGTDKKPKNEEEYDFSC